MFVNKGYTKFSDFFKIVYESVIPESEIAERFKEQSKNGNKEGMIKILADISCVKNAKILESYKAKDDLEAAVSYKESHKMISKETMIDDEEDRNDILKQTLFKASVRNNLFLDSLMDCAQCCYNSESFVKCLKYCECMLAIPECFYNKTVENMSILKEHKNACLQLKRNCLEKLRKTASQKKGRRKNCSEKEKTILSNCIESIPKVDGKPNAILKSCSDAVTLEYDEKRGRHLVASRNIKPGCVLIVESPFAYSTNKEAFERNCLHCHVSLKLDNSAHIPCYVCQTVSFCSEECRSEGWKSYHQYECPIFDAFYENISEPTKQHNSHLLLAYRMTIAGAVSKNNETQNNSMEEDMIPSLNEEYLQYHVSNRNDNYSNIGINEAYISEDYRTVINLETHCAETEPKVNLIRAIEAIFLAKCFIFVLGRKQVICTNETFLLLAVATLHHLLAINYNAYEIVENTYDKNAHIWEPRNVGGAIYPAVSLVNHSCYPNVVRHSYPSGIVVVRSLRFIGKGAEILDCYGPHWLSDGKLSRREYLWEKYHFICMCEVCSKNLPYPSSDTINYKCRSCFQEVGPIILGNDLQQRAVKEKCSKCNEKIDCKKVQSQLQKSVEKRLKAVSRMYKGDYENALPGLLEHIQFIEKFFTVPNVETIKTQQCVVQCYNTFGCISR